MGLHELSQLIPVTTPVGRGYAIFIEYEAHDYWWTVVIENGAVVTFSQDRIRVQNSYTHRRGISDEEMIQIIRPRSRDE